MSKKPLGFNSEPFAMPEDEEDIATIRLARLNSENNAVEFGVVGDDWSQLIMFSVDPKTGEYRQGTPRYGQPHVTDWTEVEKSEVEFWLSKLDEEAKTEALTVIEAVRAKVKGIQ